MLIYIHGIGHQAPAHQLKARWDLAVAGRELQDDSAMAYWADLLHASDDSAAAAGATLSARSKTVDVAALLQARDLASNPDAVALARNLMTRLGAADTASGRVGRKVLPLPSWARKPISRVFLTAFLGDVAAYFFGQQGGRPLREVAQERLRAQLIAAKGRPITLVAHSLGSVIAFEALSQLRTEDGVKLETFITLGSPLGLDEIQDFLQPQGLKVPAVVKHWINFADPLDPVAADKAVTADFAPQRGVSVVLKDELILNRQSQQLWGFNPHAAEGYLAHPWVRRAIHASARMDSMARFVMARDVAERLAAAPEVRHPVLIEVLEPGYGALGESDKATRDMESKLKAADTLQGRVQQTAERLSELLEEMQHDPAAARIDLLRRFVAAHLTADELARVAQDHANLRVYAVWRSATKRRLTDRRSHAVIKSDAALTSFGADGHKVTWAVLDTGIQANHPHFKNTPLKVYDCTRVGPPVLVKAATDKNGHGTHVSGIIAGAAASPKSAKPDAEPVPRGIAPAAALVVYKVLDDQGQGEDAWIIKAMDHIAQTNANRAEGLAIHGVNLSLGGPFDPTVYGCGFSPLCAELRRLWRDGVLAVVACGNEGLLQVSTPDGVADLYSPMSVGDPANLEECIAVGSVHADKPHLYGVSSFSSRGPTADGRPKPDVVAPGERILSCNARWKGQGQVPYIQESGTSMAAPMSAACSPPFCPSAASSLAARTR
ncbi:S8 family serine peptidase [Ideonella paludis]|uniref:S8 family serine peptidase n=1 Tax=Ideonella paludis TaxID=1233411 RepID=UPI00362818BB